MSVFEKRVSYLPVIHPDASTARLNLRACASQGEAQPGKLISDVDLSTGRRSLNDTQRAVIDSLDAKPTFVDFRRYDWATQAMVGIAELESQSTLCLPSKRWTSVEDLEGGDFGILQFRNTTWEHYFDYCVDEVTPELDAGAFNLATQFLRAAVGHGYTVEAAVFQYIVWARAPSVLSYKMVEFEPTNERLVEMAKTGIAALGFNRSKRSQMVGQFSRRIEATISAVIVGGGNTADFRTMFEELLS